MSDAQQGPGWWQASDGKWYPPESHPSRRPPPPPPPQATPPPPGSGAPAPHPGPPLGSVVAGGVTYELASWWSRVGAALLDFLIIWILPALLGLAAGLAAGWPAGLAVGIPALLIGWMYPSIMMWKTDGLTVGKRATGIRVVQESGAPFDFGSAFLREFVIKGIAVNVANSASGGIAGLVNVLWPLWDDENRAVHDMIVKTRVVQDDGNTPTAPHQGPNPLVTKA